MRAQVQMAVGILRMAWLYRWLALTASTVLCLGGWAYVLTLPDQFQVSAKLFIDTQSILKPLLSGMVIGETGYGDTVSLMRRTLLTRPTLEELARRTDLDLRATTPAAQDALITNLAEQINISASNRRDNTYELSYIDKDPRLTKKIVDELLSIFLESAIGDSREDRAVAQQFLEKQIAEYERRLIEAEERLKDFKLKNMGLMPGSGQDYYQRMGEAEDKLKGVRSALKEAERRRDELKRQLAEQGNVLEDDEPLFGMSGDVVVDPAKSPEVVAIDSRIESMQVKIDELKLQFTDKHPDIRQALVLIEALREEREAALEKAQQEQDALPPPPDLGDLELESPIKQQITLALSSADAEVAALKSREEDFLNQLEQLKGMRDTVPQVEAEMQRLNRDYEINRDQYAKLVARRESAKLSQDAETASDPVKIKVIDPTRMPIAPIGPPRLKLLSAVLALGLGAGFGLAFVVSQLRPRVYTRQELRDLTGLPVLGAVTFVRNRWHQSERRMELAVFSLGVFALVAAYIGLVSLHIMKIDVAGYLEKTLGGVL